MSLNQLQKKIFSIRNQLKSQFFERDHIIDAAFAAILSRQHMLQLGPPGTGKSAIIREICSRVQGFTYFEQLLTMFSTPEDVFGPVSLKGMEDDKFKRITRSMLPDANIAFIDEINFV